MDIDKPIKSLSDLFIYLYIDMAITNGTKYHKNTIAVVYGEMAE